MNRELKAQLARQPSYDVHDEIRNLREEIKKKNSQIILLNTDNNVHQTEKGNKDKTLDEVREELNLTKQRLVDLQKQNIKNRETIGKLKKQQSVEELIAPRFKLETAIPAIRY